MAEVVLKSDVPKLDLDETINSQTRLSGPYKINKLSFKWVIENFSQCCLPDSGKCLFSPLQSNVSEKTIWALQLYPNGSSDSCSGYVSVVLYQLSKSEPEVLAEYSFSVLTVKETTAHAVKGEAVFKDHGWGEDKFLNNQLLNAEKDELLPNDELTLLCDVYVRVYQSTQELNEAVDSFTRKQNNLYEVSKFMASLLDGGRFADFTLRVEGKEIKAHKAILSDRSPVFNSMFQHQMQENLTDSVDITDMSYATLDQFVFYIYTRLPYFNNDWEAIDMFITAEKYDVVELKMAASEFLRYNLSVHTAVEVLVLADLYNDTDLKSATMHYMCKCLSSRKVTKSLTANSTWSEKMKTQAPHLWEKLQHVLHTQYQ